MTGELAYDPDTGQLVYSPSTGQLAMDCGGSVNWRLDSCESSAYVITSQDLSEYDGRVVMLSDYTCWTVSQTSEAATGTVTVLYDYDDCDTCLKAAAGLELNPGQLIIIVSGASPVSGTCRPYDCGEENEVWIRELVGLNINKVWGPYTGLPHYGPDIVATWSNAGTTQKYFSSDQCGDHAPPPSGWPEYSEDIDTGALVLDSNGGSDIGVGFSILYYVGGHGDFQADPGGSGIMVAEIDVDCSGSPSPCEDTGCGIFPWYVGGHITVIYHP